MSSNYIQCKLGSSLNIFSIDSARDDIRNTVKYFNDISGGNIIGQYKVYRNILCGVSDGLKIQLKELESEPKNEILDQQIKILHERMEEINIFKIHYLSYLDYLYETLHRCQEYLNETEDKNKNKLNTTVIKELLNQYVKDSNFPELPIAIKAINKLPVSLIEDISLGKINLTNKNFYKHFVGSQSISESINLFKFYYFYLADFNYDEFKNKKISYAKKYSTKEAEQLVSGLIDRKEYLQDIINILIMDGWIIIKDIWTTARIKRPRIILDEIQNRPDRAQTFSGGGQIDIVVIIIAALVVMLLITTYEYLSQSVKFERYKPKSKSKVY
jgi:hypothetical protein